MLNPGGGIRSSLVRNGIRLSKKPDPRLENYAMNANRRNPEANAKSKAE